MNINGSTTVTGIFGYPIAHTLSPSMHNAAFKALGLDFVYVPFQVAPGDLQPAVNSLRVLGIRGINITVPHKEHVVRFLDKIDPLARSIGSVNTVVNDNGILTGYNTDGKGFLRDLASQEVKPEGKTVLLVGAGGAGHALAATLSWAKAGTIYITDANEKLARKLVKQTARTRFVPLSDWKMKINECDILVNATPIGLHDHDPALVETRELKRDLFVYDLIYHRRTKLAQAARKAGARYSDGLGMLLFQGALAFELWTKKKAPVDVMRKALIKNIKK